MKTRITKAGATLYCTKAEVETIRVALARMNAMWGTSLEAAFHRCGGDPTDRQLESAIGLIKDIEANRAILDSIETAQGGAR